MTYLVVSPLRFLERSLLSSIRTVYLDIVLDLAPERRFLKQPVMFNAYIMSIIKVNQRSFL